MDAPHLLIGTPAYGGMVHIDYLNAISSFHRASLQFDLLTIGNESLITRGRNTILSAFHHDRRYSHLLFLDGDVHLPADGLIGMLGHGVDVIGAPVPMKGRDERGGRIFSFGPCVGEEGALYKVTRIATAALLLSRRAVDALVAEAEREGKVYRLKNPAATGRMPERHFDVFRVGSEAGEYVSEDYGVCDQLRRLGFSIFVDPVVMTRHQGMMAF